MEAPEGLVGTVSQSEGAIWFAPTQYYKGSKWKLALVYPDLDSLAVLKKASADGSLVVALGNLRYGFFEVTQLRAYEG